MVNFKEERTLAVMQELSFFATAEDKSGTRAVESEPIIVDGINKNGKVIPIAVPYNETNK